MSLFSKIFKVPELRRRILYTLAMLGVYRMFIFVTIPGVDRSAMINYLEAQSSSGNGGLLNLFNFFTGGALAQLSVVSLGIMPYITSSIIMQLLVVVIPSLEQMKKEGQKGAQKINQYTRYGTVVITIVQSILLTSSVKSINHNGTSVVNAEWASALGGYGFVLLAIVTLSAGTALLMWIGERVTEKGVGNGISLIIFAGIVARLPNAIFDTISGIKEGLYQPMEMLMFVIMMIAVIAAIVFVERGQRRIPIQYPKRRVDGKEFGGQATHLPLKVNTAGVIPPIFASSLLMFPATAAGLIEADWMTSIQSALAPGTWLYQTVFVGLIIFFAFFQTAMTFNAVEVADNLKKFGGFVPGIRPGKATAEYIDHVLTRVTSGGAVYLALVCVMPVIFQQLSSNQIPFYFGGTGLLIVVGVALDTYQQVEGYLISQEYEGFSGAADTYKIQSRSLSE